MKLKKKKTYNCYCSVGRRRKCNCNSKLMATRLIAVAAPHNAAAMGSSPTGRPQLLERISAMGRHPAVFSVHATAWLLARSMLVSLLPPVRLASNRGPENHPRSQCWILGEDNPTQTNPACATRFAPASCPFCTGVRCQVESDLLWGPSTVQNPIFGY